MCESYLATNDSTEWSEQDNTKCVKDCVAYMESVSVT